MPKRNEIHLLTYPDPFLTWRTKPVTDIKTQVKPYLKEMFAIMKAFNGMGLSANQVGLEHSFFIMEYEGEKLIAINPRITYTDMYELGYEGCLSIPGQVFPKHRFGNVTLAYIGVNGKETYKSFFSLEARCIQHECEHLAGKLLNDPINDPNRVTVKE